MNTAELYTWGGIVMVETIERDDPHPKGATREDGSKLAVVNCTCRYCISRHMRRELEELEGKVWSGGIL